MDQCLIHVLGQLKLARVQVFPKTIRKQINLFEIESGPEISFNGFKTLIDYQSHLDQLYLDCKGRLSEQFEEGLSQTEVLKRRLDIIRFEVKEFKSRYFPKHNELVMLNRIELVKTARTDVIDDAGLKKKL